MDLTKTFFGGTSSYFSLARGNRMLFPILVIFLAIGTAIGDERECQVQTWHKCHIANIPEEMPETMEDLKRDCGFVRDIVKCMEDENEKCKGFDAMQLRKIIQFLETNCDEDSSLYQAVSRNYDCIQPIAKNIEDQCHISVEDWKNLIDSLSMSEGLSRPAKYCQYPMYFITCIAHIIGVHCGQEAKETVPEILWNLRWNFRNCNEESILTELQPLGAAFESTFTEAPEPENTILK